MISRTTSSVPKDNVVFPRLLYCDSRRSQTCPRHSQVLPGLSSALSGLSPVLPGAPKVLSGAPRCSQTYHNHSHDTPVPVIRDPSYSEGRQKCPPRVWYSPEIDASKFTLHILSDTPGVFQWLKYILLLQHGAGSMSLLLLPLTEANPSVMTICNQCLLWLPRMQDLPSWMRRWRSSPGFSRERLSTFFDHIGGQNIHIEHWRTIVNIVRLRVGYPNATINRTTRNLKPETGPDGYIQTRSILRVDGYWARF